MTMESLAKFAHTRCIPSLAGVEACRGSLTSTRRSNNAGPRQVAHSESALSFLFRLLLAKRGSGFLDALASDLNKCQAASDVDPAAIAQGLAKLAELVAAVQMHESAPKHERSPPAFHPVNLRNFLTFAVPQVEKLDALTLELGEATVALRRHLAESTERTLPDMFRSLALLLESLRGVQDDDPKGAAAQVAEGPAALKGRSGSLPRLVQRQSGCDVLSLELVPHQHPCMEGHGHGLVHYMLRRGPDQRLGIQLEECPGALGAQIRSIAECSSARSEGAIQVGDRLVKVNGICVAEAPLDDVKAVLRSGGDVVSVLVQRAVGAVLALPTSPRSCSKVPVGAAAPAASLRAQKPCEPRSAAPPTVRRPGEPRGTRPRYQRARKGSSQVLLPPPPPMELAAKGQERELLRQRPVPAA